MPSIITGGRINRGLQKIFGVKADVVGSALADDISSAFRAGAASDDEQLAQFGWRLYARDLTQAQSLGNTSEIYLQNPPASGVVGVLEYATIDEGPVANLAGVALLLRSANNSISAQGVHRDIRQTAGVVNIGSVCGLGAAVGDTAGSRLGFEYPELISGTENFYRLRFQERRPILLLPGEYIAFRTTITNQAITVSCWWRERALDPSEATV